MAEAVAQSDQEPCLGCELGPPHPHLCDYIDTRSTHPATIRFADLMGETDINKFVRKITPKVVNGTEIFVANTRGKGLGTWGQGKEIPIAQAKIWTKALALSCEDPRLRWMWDSPFAVDCKARALAILEEQPQRDYHGCTTCDAKRLRYDYRANGDIAEVRWTRVGGDQKRGVVRFHSHLMGALYESEACGTSPLGVAEATSRLAGFVLDAPARYDDV